MGTRTCLLVTDGVTAWTLQEWTPSPKAHVLVVAGPSHRRAVTTEESPPVPMVQGQGGGSHKTTDDPGGRESSGFSFPVGATRDSWSGAALAWRRRGVVSALLFLRPSSAVSWSPWRWMWFSLTFPIPEFSPWCLVLEELLVSLLLRGTEVRNSLCDVTLKYIFIYGMR